MTERVHIDILPTCVPKGVRDMQAAAEKIRVFSERVHLDIDDGIFEETMSWPYEAPGQFNSNLSLAPFAGMDVEVHLMVKEPRQIGAAFAHAGAHRIIAHVEAFRSDMEGKTALDYWRASGASEVGVAALLETPLELLAVYAPHCDVIQLMSINVIGLQGAQFDARVLPRIAQLHAQYPDKIIAVDGGVSELNVGSLIEAGARRFSVGSAIFHDPEPSRAFASIVRAAQAGAALV